MQRLEQIQGQTQVLAPQLRQSLKILQVPALELRNVIREELQFNPTLEELPNEEISIEGAETEDQEKSEEEIENKEIDFNKENYIDRLDKESKEYYFEDHIHEDRQDQEERYAFTLNSIVHQTSLQEHLLQQAQLTDSPAEEIDLIRYMLGSLDERGFLTASDEEIAQQTQKPLAAVRQALKTLQSLEPTGIACRNTQECLLRQLVAQNKGGSLAARLLRECYDLLLHNKFSEIARALDVDKEKIRQAIQEITQLDPAPGRHFDTETVQGIIPDVTVYKNDGEWVIQLNNEFIPSLRISQTYKDLIGKKDLATGDKNYLKIKMRSGKFLIHAIAQRQKTLERIAQALLEVQNAFFEEGPKGLKPLTLQVLAERLEVHETTISRAIANKFLDTPFGVFEFKYFFTKGIMSEEGHSVANTIIKQKISEFVKDENPKKPLSDQKIVELLERDNICIARRTVAKYREELGIPATNLRKKH